MRDYAAEAIELLGTRSADDLDQDIGRRTVHGLAGPVNATGKSREESVISLSIGIHSSPRV